jgi:hypothetical protein
MMQGAFPRCALRHKDYFMIIQFNAPLSCRLEHLLVRFSELGYLPLTRLSPSTFAVCRLEWQREHHMLLPSDQVRSLIPSVSSPAPIKLQHLPAILQIAQSCTRKPSSWFGQASSYTESPAMFTLPVQVNLIEADVSSRSLWTGVMAIAELCAAGATQTPTRLLERIEALRETQRARQQPQPIQPKSVPQQYGSSLGRWPFRPVNLGASSRGIQPYQAMPGASDE